MRFSVDAHAIGQHLTGNETYVRNLLWGFAALGDESEFITYVSRASAFEEIPGTFQKRLVAENPFVRVGFDLARAVKRDRPDLLHVQYTAPLLCNVPIVVTVHDVSFLEHPEYFTAFRAAQLRTTVRRTVKRAARVLTPSEFSKQSILRAYGLNEDKVVVVPNAVSSSFRPLSRDVARTWLRSRFNLAFPFILSVSDIQPRKNFVTLIAAFEELVRNYPQLPHHLVIVGKKTWFSHTVQAAAHASSVRDRIHFTGFVSDEELLRLYGGCDLFVYPSLYEGFGLPILEAMACGRAVACSNTSAMPEVADSSALQFNPRSKREIVRAIADLLLDSELRNRMERLGLQRSTIFSWQRTAEKTLDVYYQAVGNTAVNPTSIRKAHSAAW